MTNPFSDPEYFVDYDLKGKDIIVPEKPLPQRSSQAQPPQQGIVVVNTYYKDVEFEPLAYREENAADKKLLTFDKSLERLKARGFERHARPQEAFGLMRDGLEKRLTDPSLQSVNTDMMTSYGEWFSLAFERKGDVLTCYLDPEGLIWDNTKKKYVKTGFKCADQKDFTITGKPSLQWIELKAFPDDFVTYVYGCSFNKLPNEMKEGGRKVHVGLPAEGVAWPVARGDGGCGVGGYYYGRASRGVRRAQKISTGNKGP